MCIFIKAGHGRSNVNIPLYNKRIFCNCQYIIRNLLEKIHSKKQRKGAVSYTHLVLVISSRTKKAKKKKNSFLYSMRLWLVVALIAVTISPLFIMRLVALNNIEVQLRTRRGNELSNYALILSNQIVRSNYFKGENMEIVHADMNQSASMYNRCV